jgi:hypothetical protein
MLWPRVVMCIWTHPRVLQIYHLASPASPPHYMFNPIKTIKTNAVGAWRPTALFFCCFRSLQRICTLLLLQGR